MKRTLRNNKKLWLIAWQKFDCQWSNYLEMPSTTYKKSENRIAILVKNVSRNYITRLLFNNKTIFGLILDFLDNCLKTYNNKNNTVSTFNLSMFTEEDSIIIINKL